METHLQRVEGLARNAATHYEMLTADDKVCVGVSGGKDSVVLALALQNLSCYYGLPYTVHAVTLDPGFTPHPVDYTPLEKLFAAAGIPYYVKRTDIGHVVFDTRQESNPCALCAKMRRGILHTAAEELGCNKIALGHHLNDAVETFYMNLWQGGRLACFSPKSYLSRRGLTLIRPLVFATENEIIAAANGAKLPIISAGCPVDGTTNRQKMKEYVNKRTEEDPAFLQKNLGAMQKAGLSGW